jgi:GNAT superfamily N-acetyltransferase
VIVVTSTDYSPVDDTQIDDVFIGLVGPAFLLTGTSITIIAATPDDLDRVRRFYEELGAESTHLRFFSTRREIPDAELRAVVAHNIPKHVTLMAEMDSRVIGIGEFIVGDDPTEAEVAFAVADDHHHEGVGTLLLERLAVIGKRVGLRRLTARTLTGNRAMMLVFRTAGLPCHSGFDGSEVQFVLDLDGLDELDRQAAHRHAFAKAAAAQTTSRP